MGIAYIAADADVSTEDLNAFCTDAIMKGHVICPTPTIFSELQETHPEGFDPARKTADAILAAVSEVWFLGNPSSDVTTVSGHAYHYWTTRRKIYAKYMFKVNWEYWKEFKEIILVSLVP